MDITRREFLKGLGVMTGAAGMSAVGGERLIPYLNKPEDITPGVSTWFATSCRECPAGCGMLVRNRDSRSVKCEGNPLHPISKGRLCARGQAALHGLYDPDRVWGPMSRAGSGKYEKREWTNSLTLVGGMLADAKNIVILSDLQTGSLSSLMRSSLGARLVIYEPINYEPVKATNSGIVPTYHINHSDYIISFGSDFLETWLSPVEFAHDFAQMRQVSGQKRGPFLYVGPRVSATAASADFRILVPPDTLEQVALALTNGDISSIASRYGLDKNVLSAAARGLASAKAPLAMPGWDMDSARAAALINQHTRSKSIDLSRPHAVTAIGPKNEMNDLIVDMEAGSIDALIVYGANPAFSLPDTKRFSEALKRVKTTISLSSFFDETAALCDWILPSSTPLESWGDYQPYPDVINLMQPTMGSVFNTHQAGDILLQLANRAGKSSIAKTVNWYGYLRSRWESLGDWESLLQKGGQWPATGVTSISGSPKASPSPTIFSSVEVSHSKQTVKLWAFPHIYYYDGRGANRRWLQEMPEPVTKAVWGTWAEMHPATAHRLGLSTDDVVRISHGTRSINVPVYVWEGVAHNVIAVPMGQGHTQYGRYAKGTGENVFPLIGETVKITQTGHHKWVTRIKGSTNQHGRNIVQTTLVNHQQAREEPVIMPTAKGYSMRDFYPGHKYMNHRWAMVVDLNKCIGCHACVAACYAENNLGIVGPEGIWRRREMSWIRIDRYIDWNNTSAPLLFQPMLCQHCDSAPCEPVCPVYAAAHSDEGLNMQIYNRCVGTRYCSNNCPYKVRRFNWFDYNWPEPLNWQLNPDVTVRCRGVMEKCTFCIQRIREVEIIAKREGRSIRDGDIKPACVQTCPTGVFTFGDLMDKKSEVSQIYNNEPRAYQVLHQLNTKPAVLYLKRIIT